MRPSDLVPSALIALVAAAAIGVGASCATTSSGDAVTSDTASIKTRMAGVISKYKSEKQGNVERATFAAEGCGDSEVYTVECIRGVCFAVQDVPVKKNAKLKESGP